MSLAASEAVPAATPQVVSLTPRPRRPHLPPGLRVLQDAARSMGMSMWATRGAGKSRILGRIIAWQDFFRNVPLVIIDPIGGTIDNLLDKIFRRPPREREALWTRIRYVNINGQEGRVVPWPIYAPVGRERPSTTVQRYIDVLMRADPEMIKAPIQGLNALAPLATAGGLILCALNLGITELFSLVSEPGRWQTGSTSWSVVTGLGSGLFGECAR